VTTSPYHPRGLEDYKSLSDEGLYVRVPPIGIAHQYWYSRYSRPGFASAQRSRTADRASSAGMAGSAATLIEDGPELLDVLLEVADEEAIEDAADRHLTEPWVKADSRGVCARR
jgi:hypothetical protein